jgi:hypothetical protein
MNDYFEGERKSVISSHIRGGGEADRKRFRFSARGYEDHEASEKAGNRKKFYTGRAGNTGRIFRVSASGKERKIRRKMDQLG